MTPLRFLALVLLAGSARAAEFAPVFTDNAVLQRDMPVTVWGSGRDGEKVTVEFGKHQATTTAQNGRWQLTLPAMPAAEGAPLRLRGDNVVELNNVAVGEVWICSGQSNMEWRLNQSSPFTDAVLAAPNEPAIRQIKVPLRPYAGDPLPAFAWTPFNAKSAGFFSGVAFFFAAKLHRELGVPVGLVNCSFGGTPIEAWMSREAITRAGSQKLLEDDAKKAAAYPDAAAYEKAWQSYLVARKAWDAAQKAGKTPAELGPQPAEPYGFRTKGRPAGLRESMLGVITPYTARGVLWYQGENNAGRPQDYAALLTQLIASFREDWRRPDLPVFIGQISSPSPNWPDEQDPYARIREAQRAVAVATPHSGFVVSLDYGVRAQVHPPDKQPIGERFAALALQKVYGRKDAAGQSPWAREARLGPDAVTVSFADLGGTLVARDPAIPTLELQLPDGTWVPATAKAAPDGQSLRVALPPNARPQAVRYAWRNFCPLSLYSANGRPVSPWSLPVTP